MPPDLWPSVCRALLLSVLAVAWSGWMGPRLHEWRLGALGQRWLWGMAGLPFFFPGLLTAYAYGRPFLHLSRYPWMEEGIYLMLMFLRFFPLALLARACVTRLLSQEARFYAQTNGLASDWHFRWRHLDPALWVTGLAVFLCVFHEFEMASLWQRPAWTVAIFDFQAQGYVLEATWRRMGGVLLLQGLLLWLGFVSLRRAESGGHHARGKALTRGDRLVVSGYLVVAGLLTAGIPSMLLLVEALPGWERLWRTFSMGREVAHSLVVAFVAATVAYFTAQGLVKVCHRHPGALLLLVPGLSGALTLGLSLHSAIQWSPLHGVRDRPLPMVFGLGLLVLPWLTVLLAVARQRECGSAGWLAQRAHAPRLLWSYVRAPRLAIWSLGFYWSYLDVVVSALLAPSSVTPVMTRLYNLMHYGHDTMLSAYVMVILAAPLGVVALAFALGRWLTWKSHA